MSVYAYTKSKVIDEIAFKQTANGALRAYVHACPQATPEKIEDVLQSLKGAGMECIPFTVDGKPVLEVRGFKRDSQLVTLLAERGFTGDEAHVIQEKDDKQSWSDVFRKRSLQLSGGAFMVADLGFAMYGAKEKSWEDTLAGLSYLAGSTTLAAYGRNDQSSLQIREGAQLIMDYARHKGYNIPDDTAIASVGVPKRETPLQKVDNFFRAHPSEIGNMGYVLAGALIAKSALQHRALAKPRAGMSSEQVRKMRYGGWGDTALGSLTVTSGLTGTFVKERAVDPDAKKHGSMFSPSGFVEWVKESPLRAAGYGYMGSTLCHCITTFVERKEAKRVLKDAAISAAEKAHAAQKLKAIPWRVMFVSMTLVGEILMSISSKGHGEGVVSDNTVDDSIVAVAAELIIKQPKNLQEGLIQEMGKFLGRPEVLALKDEEAVNRLRRQVEEMRQNPWATKLREMDAAPPKPAQPLAVPKGDMPAWQAKLATAEAKQQGAPGNPLSA